MLRSTARCFYSLALAVCMGLLCQQAAWGQALGQFQVFTLGQGGYLSPESLTGLQTLTFNTGSPPVTGTGITASSSLGAGGFLATAGAISYSSVTSNEANFDSKYLQMTSGTGGSTGSTFTVNFSGSGTTYVSFLWNLAFSDDVEYLNVKYTISNGTTTSTVDVGNCPQKTVDCIPYYATDSGSWLLGLIGNILSGLLDCGGPDTSGTVRLSYKPPAGYKITKMEAVAKRNAAGLLCLGQRNNAFKIDNFSYVDPGSVPSLHSLRLSTTSSPGLTCTPTSFTIKACANSDCSTPYTSGVTGTFTLTGTGTANPSSISFTTSSDNDASATVSSQITTVGTMTAGVTVTGTPGVSCGTGLTQGTGATCNVSTVNSALLLSVPNHASEVQQVLTVSAIKADDSNTKCVPAFANGTAKSINFKCAYSNPTTGFVPVRVADKALNNGNNAGAACDATGQSASLTFNSGVATAKFQYADVGRMDLSASYTGPTSGTSSDKNLIMTGSTSVTVVPASFRVDNVTTGAIKAGEPFSATVTAVNSAGATTRNFGSETSPATVTMSLSKTKPTGPGTSAGTLTGGPTTFKNVSNVGVGVGVASNLAWSEVGYGLVNADLTGGTYLGVASSATGSSASAAGPFVPHRFKVSSVSACVSPAPSTAAFTYSGQPFETTVTAVNSAGDITINYDKSATTVDPQAKAVALVATGAAGTLANASVSDTAFVLGRASLAGTAAPSFTFGTKATAPTTITLNATEASGSSPVTSVGMAASQGSVALRSGRLKISNVFGSGKQSLDMPVQLQYWTGNVWAVNAIDVCSGAKFTNAATVVRAAYKDSKGNASSDWSTTPAWGSFTNGNGKITFSPPPASTPAKTGSVDIAINLGSATTDLSCLSAHPASTGAGMPWLRSAYGSCGSLNDPSARVTFGVYSPESSKTVHARELY
ncbi:hypothetical protein EIP75_17360 [Aquabacterium soli]|uniref:DUF6701 domain-containing protein n=1 Tax=Aquabacterium soli TaxID=2493092 RepID=A0A3R8S5V7_9BURK|nr:DUF6701 domain-containing protein [Aquabacterium soli]RRS03089.1 hypothetical protein EIP75_17360 [Aquabacterium soli]